MKTALIDGDIIIYSAGFASDKRSYLIPKDGKLFKYKKDAKKYCIENTIEPDTIEKIVEPDTIENTLGNTRKLLNSIMEKTGSDNAKVYLSGDNNFRKKLYPEYKENRDASHKPYYFEEIKTYLKDIYHAETIHGVEADDALGVYQTSNIADTVLCSIDKDMLMIPGEHYNWRKDEFHFVSEFNGFKHFCSQLLMGDRADNIPGIKGVGEKKAGAILNGAASVDELFDTVTNFYVSTYKKKFEEHLDLRANLLWIQRYKYTTYLEYLNADVV